MIYLLIVESDPLSGLVAPPEFEALRAHSAEEALEKLSRNRRIDAVLFFEEDLARATSARIREEDPAGPPLFLSGEADIAGVIRLDPGDVFSAIEAHLGGQ